MLITCPLQNSFRMVFHCKNGINNGRFYKLPTVGSKARPTFKSIYLKEFPDQAAGFQSIKGTYPECAKA